MLVSIYADFIGMTFGSTNQAETVLEAMGVMRRKALLGLDEAVVVACDPKGQISLRSEFDPADAEESAARSLLMLLVQAIAEAAPGDQALRPGVIARAQALATCGLDTVLVKSVRARLTPGSSAIFFLIPKESLANANAVETILRLFDGQLHRTTLSEQSAVGLSQMVNMVL